MSQNYEITYCNYEDPKWYWMLASSAVALAFGVGSILACRLMQRLCKFVRGLRAAKRAAASPAVAVAVGIDNRASSCDAEGPVAVTASAGPSDLDMEEEHHLGEQMMEVGYLSEAKDWAGTLMSGRSNSGRVLVVFIFLVSVGSVVLYINDTRWVTKNRVERCDKWATSVEQQIDFSFNLIFFVYFFVRLLAANDRLWFFFELDSLVDILTVPPAFVSVALSRNWIGLRFTRVLRLTSLPDILQYLNITRSSTAIRLMQLVTLFSVLVLTTAGFVHLVENSGDPPLYNNAQNLTYFNSIYYMVVTFSTVGFGDVSVRTITGKALMVFFILGGLAVFANSLPEIADIVSSR